MVIGLAGKLGIPMAEEDITAERLYGATECFLTGTAAEVIAVTRIDDRQVGDGKAGPITQELLAAFREYIASGDWE